MIVNDGPFYNYDKTFRSFKLHDVCQKCEYLKVVQCEKINDQLSWNEIRCSCENGVCPKLGDILKGALRYADSCNRNGRRN